MHKCSFRTAADEFTLKNIAKEPYPKPQEQTQPYFVSLSGKKLAGGLG